MASQRRTDKKNSRPRRPAAPTPELRENQLISAAVDLAERQLSDGTASAQVISHYLKLGSSRERLEQHRIQLESELLAAKRDAMKSAERVEELYEGAINAMRAYNGQDPLVMVDDDDD